MTSFLFCFRLCIEIGNQHVRCVRTFSVTDAINALRPFYLAVHPDFFGQHPREREMNENSLKKLNNHLQCLQHPGHRAPQPTKLTFYVRETAGNAGAAQNMNTPGFRAVSFTLQTQDLLGTVVNILKSCCLSIDHIQDSKAAVDSPHQNGSISFSRPIKWDKTYYTFTGYRDPEEELDSSRQLEPILGMWLNKNVSLALKRLSVSLPLREDLKNLKTKLCEQLEVTDIRWRKSWGIAHRCSQLHSLSRFAQQNSAILHNIKGGSRKSTMKSQNQHELLDKRVVYINFCRALWNECCRADYVGNCRCPSALDKNFGEVAYLL